MSKTAFELSPAARRAIMGTVAGGATSYLTGGDALQGAALGGLIGYGSAALPLKRAVTQVTKQGAEQIKQSAYQAVLAQYGLAKKASAFDAVSSTLARPSFIAGQGAEDFIRRFAAMSAAKRGLIEGGALGALGGYATSQPGEGLQGAVGGGLAGAALGGAIGTGLGYNRGQSLAAALGSNPALMNEANEMRQRYLSLRDLSKSVSSLM